MKVIAFIVDVVVLVILVSVMIFVVGDTYSKGGILTKTLLMAAVGGVYGLLRSIYRKWLLPEEEKE